MTEPLLVMEETKIISKSDLTGDTYIVLVEGEYAGWLNIPKGAPDTQILRAGLSSNPTIVEITNLPIDIKDLPAQASGQYWNGTTFSNIKE